MERVLQRTAQAKIQAARRLARETAKEKKRDRRTLRERTTRLTTLHNREKARVYRELVEDHKLGPLAPRRGLDSIDREQRDVLSEYSPGNTEVPKSQRIKFWNIIPGDRVVLLNGKDRNKVGIVSRLEKETNSVIVEGLNMYPFRVPSYMKPGENNVPTIMDREIGIPYGSVRLVVPIKDPQTDVLRDAIVKRIGMSTPYYDKSSRRVYWTRYIPYLNEAIPWPPRKKPDQVDHPVDTKSKVVAERTYIPNLLRHPFPESVIDELRGKYSKFRDRHDEDYVKTKTKEDEDAKRWKQAVMATPLKELNRKIRMEKKILGKTQKLTDDILEKIGRAMAGSKPAFAADRSIPVSSTSSPPFPAESLETPDAAAPVP